MPWDAMSIRERRLEFVKLALAAGVNLAELCRRFAVSRRTAYKWLHRYRAAGEAGLVDRSRRPRSSPGQVDGALEAAVLAVRRQHPTWGGRKIGAVLQRGGIAPPAPSTVTAIVKRHGLPVGLAGGGPAAFQRFERALPNELWQMDFKGHVALRCGRLHPLTVLDDHSRFNLVLAACADQRGSTVRERLIEAFRRYGLPDTLITDNGPPWGDGRGAAFTPLGVFLIELGIRVAHAAPYHPQTMGKDERFHRTLKAEVLAGPPFADLAQAARAFHCWRNVYNHERPHEALDMAVPAERYRASPRSYRDTIEPFDYAPGDLVRRVHHNGAIAFQGRNWPLSRAFAGKLVALRPTRRDGVFIAVFRHQIIRTVDLTGATDNDEPVTHVPEHMSPMSPV
jgi:transposase InsO family protein